ncbi:MAG: hypothetical protein DCC75_06270 [Proteobacteria bacterium]|nr:MAG: hypothetical protein DCC75_06270 [Pseudomonadota bacterium]
MEKTELPSRARLTELREQGIFPLSRVALACAGLLACGATGFGLGESINRFSAAYAKALSNQFQDIIGLRELLIPSLNLLVWPCVVAGAAMLVLGLLSSRFYFSFADCSPNLSRMSPFARARPASAGFKPLRELLMSGLAIASAVALLLMSTEQMLALLNTDVKAFRQGWIRVMSAVLPLVFFAALFLGCCGWLMARFTFLLRHRMSRREMASEED